jgi:uncharacterized membrane protein
MLVMPSQPRKSYLIGFTTSFGIVTAVILGSVAYWLTGASAAGGVVGLASILGLTLIGRVFPNAAWSLYEGWNALARGLAQLMHAWIVFVIFHVILRPVSLIRKVGDDGAAIGQLTMWQERRTLSADSFYGQSGVPSALAAQKRFWLRDLVGWGLSSGNSWVICLAPFLFLLRLTTPASSNVVPENVYTLY